jgi:pyrroline-5-carboxylate reductase
VELGLSEEDAARLARVTFEGAARLLAESGEDAAALRKKVTSPGGTTEAALKFLEARGFGPIFIDAVRAARDRGREL